MALNQTISKRLLPVICVICLALTDVFGQWVKRPLSKALTRVTAQGNDNTGNVYSAGLMICNTIFETDTLFNNSCGEVSLPPLASTQLDVFVSSHDGSGNLNWVRQLIGEVDNKILVNGMQSDAVGNSYLGGEFIYDLDLGTTTLVNDDTTSDAFLTKILPDGNTDWAVKIGATDSSLIAIQDVTVDNTSVYVSGQFRGRIDVGLDNDSVMYKSAFLASYDLSGNPQWLRTLPPVETTSESIGQAVTTDNGFLFMLVNFTDSVAVTATDTLVTPATINDASAILRYQTDGTLVSYKVLNTNNLQDVEFSFADLSLYVTGSYTNDFAVGVDTVVNDVGTKAFLLSADEDILPQWTLPISSNVSTGLQGNSISVNSVGNIFVAGSYAGNVVSVGAISTTGNSTLNGFLLKTDVSGTETWLQTIGGNGSDEALTISALDEDNIYCGGYFEDYIRFGGEEIFNQSVATHGFIAKIDICPELVANVDNLPINYLCEGETLALQATQDVTYTYQWYKDDVIIAGANTFDYATIDVGVYDVEITGLGCTKFTPSREFRLNALPDTTVVVNNSLLLCLGDSITLSGPTSTSSFQWLESGTPIVGATNGVLKVGSSGDYSLQVTTDSLCVLSSNVRQIQVFNYPDSSLNLESRQVICEGDNILLQAENDPTYSYLWFNDEDTIATATNSSYLVTETGIYNAFLTNLAGCTSLTRSDTVVVQAAPIVDLNDESIGPILCQGDSVRIVTTSISTQSYQWRRNGVDIPTETSNSITVNQGGSYTVFVSNATCDILSNSVDLADVALPPSQIISVSASTICEGESAILEANNGTGITYEWYRNDALIIGEADRFITVSLSGNYIVKVINTSGCSQESGVEQIIVNLAPPANITVGSSTTICDGETLELSGNDGTNLTYQWLSGGVAIPSATNRNLTVSITGDYIVEVTNSNLCTAQSTIETVTVIPIPNATITADLSDICQGDSLELRATVDASYNYNWLFNGNLIAGEDKNNLYAKQAGDYESIVYVGNCRDTSVVSSVTVVANSKPKITRNDDFLSSSLFGEIQWFVNNQPITNATNQNIQVVEDGYYKVEVVNDDGCSSVSDSVSICLPIPEITRVNDVLTVNVPDQQYEWYFKGSLIGGATKQNLTAQQSGEYYVIMTHDDGCAMESFPITVCVPYPFITQDMQTGVLFANPSVAKAYQWYNDTIPITNEDLNVFIPVIAGLYKVEITDFGDCTSISEVFTIAEEVTGILDEQYEFRIYPNPVSNLLHIELTNNQKTEVVITDLKGRQLIHTSLTNNGEINISRLPSGTYLAHIVTNSQSMTIKITKE